MPVADGLPGFEGALRQLLDSAGVIACAADGPCANQQKDLGYSVLMRSVPGKPRQPEHADVRAKLVYEPTCGSVAPELAKTAWWMHTRMHIVVARPVTKRIDYKSASLPYVRFSWGIE
eukprot:4517679-Prymnesium_polylepis.1